MGGGSTDSKVERKGSGLGIKIVLGGLVAAIIALGGADIHVLKERILKKELYNAVRVLADKNVDNLTDAQEWAKVYEQFGQVYDINYSDPKADLSLEQMREYLGVK
jgi:hypothetical protein